MGRGVVAIVVAGALTVTGCSWPGADDEASIGASEDLDLTPLTDALTACFQDPDPDRPTRAVLWLPVDPSDDRSVAVATILDAIPTVESYDYVDQDETHQAFAEFYADEPEILDVVAPDQLPTSFEVDFATRRLAEAATAEIMATGLVDDVELGPGPGACDAELAALREVCDAGPLRQPPRELIVWHEPGVGHADVEAVSTRLEGNDEFASVTYRDIVESMASLDESYAGRPEVVDLVDPDQVPTSWVVTVAAAADHATVEALVAELESTAGVSGVDVMLELPAEICQQALRTAPA